MTEVATVQNPFSHIRFVYRRTSMPVKALVLAMLVLCSLTLITLRFTLMQTKKELNELRAEAQALEQENDRLQKSISQLGTVQSVTELAEQLLGLVDPNTVIFEAE